MDLKGISWVGNVYQKFEAMCMDIEEVMHQDTIDYVENQVQTAGESVKKFCSEIMHDLHREPYIDPVRVAAGDLSLNPYAHTEIVKKQKSYLKEHRRGIDIKSTEDTQVIKGKMNLGGIYKRQNVAIRQKAEGNHPPLMVSLPVAPISWERNMNMKSSAHEMASDHRDSTLPMASAKVCASRATVEEICDHKPDKHMHTTVVSDQEDSGCASPFHGSSSRSNVPSILSTERPENHDSDVLNAYVVLDQEVEVINQDADETCVLVEGDELLVPQDPFKHKSYKKKIREAFSSKKKLTVKEYQNLATQYEKQLIDKDCEENAPPDLMRLKEITEKISASEFPDSEWELL